MQTNLFNLLWLSAVLLSTALSTTRVQSYSIDWSTLDGGGGASTGGVYSVSGTLGQPDAGSSMTNGQYSVTGGFWAWPALVQMPGTPRLQWTNAAPGFAALWWTPPTPGYVLQSTTNLSPANWANAPSGTNNPAPVPTVGAARFYRLVK